MATGSHVTWLAFLSAAPSVSKPPCHGLCLTPLNETTPRGAFLVPRRLPGYRTNRPLQALGIFVAADTRPLNG
ncbi:hypothetical protein BKA80DRAFT_258929 [Phyllosticta citrichinensis]